MSVPRRMEETAGTFMCSRTHTSRLLDLPPDMRQLIYERLEIKERIMYNSTVPREAAVTISRDHEKEKKLAVLHRYVERKVRLGGGAALTPESLSQSMHDFIHQNYHDPTVTHALRHIPYIRPPTIALSPMERLVTLIRAKELFGTAGIQWDAIQDIYRVVWEMTTHGTPAIFDAMMATSNPFSAAVLASPTMFMKDLLWHSNPEGLFSHIMQSRVSSSDGIAHHLPKLRAYLTTIAHQFLPYRENMRAILDNVPMERVRLVQIMEAAAREMRVETLDLLAEKGVTLEQDV